MARPSLQCGAAAREIVAEALEPYGLTLDDIRRRDRKNLVARRAAIKALRATGKYSYPSIGQLLERHHATIIVAERGSRRQVRSRDAFRARLIACHGLERATAILDGRDPATQADIAAWNRLGSPKTEGRQG